MDLRRRHSFPLRLLPALLVSLAALQAQAARLRLETAEAFEAYVAGKEQVLAERLSGRRSFLWVSEVSGGVRALKRGEVLVEPFHGKGDLEVPHGLIHDWVGAMFIPEARAGDVLATVQDYDNHKNFYGAEVVDSKLLDRDGDDYRVYLRLRKHKIVTVVLNTHHAASYGRLDSRRAYSRSYSTTIREVRNPGGRDEAELPVGQDHGFLWRLNSYWRFQQMRDGVYVECEVVALTRGVPWGFGWLIRPIMRSLPKKSLEQTLEATREAVLTAGRPLQITQNRAGGREGSDAR